MSLPDANELLRRYSTGYGMLRTTLRMVLEGKIDATEELAERLLDEAEMIVTDGQVTPKIDFARIRDTVLAKAPAGAPAPELPDADKGPCCLRCGEPIAWVPGQRGGGQEAAWTDRSGSTDCGDGRLHTTKHEEG